MSLRELINSVDSEQYSDNALYQMLRETKPEYGANRHIQVNVVNGAIAITNCHVGSLGDIITYPIDVAPELNISKVQLLDAILHELSTNNFSESEATEQIGFLALSCVIFGLLNTPVSRRGTHFCYTGNAFFLCGNAFGNAFFATRGSN